MKKSALHYLLAIFAGLTAALLPINILAAAGDLFETDQGSSTIFKFTPVGAKSTFATGLGGPFGLAIDRFGNVFEANFNTGTIFKFTPAGVKSTFASGLNGPIAFAFDASGNLFAADAVANIIFKFTPAGVRSTFALGLNMPVALAFDASGNLFEADHGSNKIFKFTPAGVKTTFASGLHGPFGLAFDAGTLFESDTGSGTIIKFTAAGVKSTFASGLNTPTGLAFDASGNLFEADQASGRIFKFTPAGAKSTFASGLSEPSGLAFEPPTAQLLNISTRASVQTGDRVTIAGFIITGTDPKQVVVRGLGPTLPQAQISLPLLQDPTLDLHNSTSSIVFNNDWQMAANSNQIPVGLRPHDPRESAILTTLQPGAYTVIMAGNNMTTGIGLVEVYDITSSVFSELANISTRAFVGTGDAVTIGGFITGGGNGSTQVVIRGLGPSLPVPGPLPNPTLAIFNANGQRIAANDNWKVDDQTHQSQQAAITATGLAPTNDLESAILVTLPAGGYTAILQGVNGGTGIGLVEVYKLR